MKIAVISDIHGNSYALQEVLNVARHIGAEKLFVLGDLIGYYYYPKQIIDLINEWDYLLIKGNHEGILADLISDKINEADVRLKYGTGHKKAIEQLSYKQMQFLINAPEKISVEYNGIKILLCHGSPWHADFYLYPDTRKSILDQCEGFGADIIFCGHSHYPFVYKSPTCLLVNCGSVGQARNLGGYAFWSLLNTENGVVQSMSTPYDTRPLIAEIEKVDPEMPYLKNILLRK